MLFERPFFARKSTRWRIFVAAWLGVNVGIFFWPYLRSKLESPSFRVSWAAQSLYRQEVMASSPGATKTFAPLSYRVLEPVSTKASQPLLLFLHGSGERGTDNIHQLISLPAQMIETQWRHRCPGFVLAPQCPPGSDWNQELDALVALIDQWRNDPRVDPRRIYVVGFSMGGSGAWVLAAKVPGWVAAAAPICGSADPGLGKQLTQLPIWAVHGSDDRVVPVEATRRMIKSIEECGGHPNFTELPGVGHHCWTQVFRQTEGLLDWLFLQAVSHCTD